MTVRSLTSIGTMLSSIPAPVQTALEDEFHSQVTTAYTKHLKDELVALQPTVPQASLLLLPPIVPEITPGKAAKPATETPEIIPGKRKASGNPTRSQPNSKNPFALLANAALAAIASATVAAVATTVTTTTVTTTTAGATTAAAGTSSENALGVPGTSATNAIEVPDSDSGDTNDTIPPRTFQKQEHGLTILYGMDINAHLKSIKSDISIGEVRVDPIAISKIYHWDGQTLYS
jgi:hypothetical protein